ncbi:MAG: glycoside hydrolase family 26 protein [Chthoniobacterales bacterium]
MKTCSTYSLYATRNSPLLLFIFFCYCSSILLAAEANALPTPVASSFKILEIPEQGTYTGAYIDFGDGEDGVTLEAIEKFQKLVGKHQAIVSFGSFWARQQFPTEQVNLVRSYGAVPLLYWSPWEEPFDQERGPDKFSLEKILDGTWDHYIDAWADGAKAVPEQFFVSFACEMNGTWFPWSGYFYRQKVKGEKPINIQGVERLFYDKKLEKNFVVGAETYKKAYRYVVNRVRARGANNILWVFQVQNYSYPHNNWNLAAAYYPGPEYVDWLAMSLFGKQYAKESWDIFGPLLDWPYKELCALDPKKPIMVAEWGTAEPHEEGDKGAWYADGCRMMISKEYPRLKAAVVWHERWANPDGSFSNLRVNSSRGALRAYREGIASPLWIDYPRWISSGTYPSLKQSP